MRFYFSLFYIVCLSVLAPATQAQSQIYKCVDKKGAVSYANSPCDAAAKPVELKGNVTTIPSKSFTAGATKAEETKRSVGGIKAPNPIQDCKDKGGTIDKELKACMLP